VEETHLICENQVTQPTIVGEQGNVIALIILVWRMIVHYRKLEEAREQLKRLQGAISSYQDVSVHLGNEGSLKFCG